jgi:hypothetical protein
MKYHRRKQQPHRGVMILVFGILAIAGFGVLAGLPAYYMGTNDLNEMYQGRMDLRGQQMTKIGRILGIVGSLLQLSAVVLFCCVCPMFGSLLGGIGGR